MSELENDILRALGELEETCRKDSGEQAEGVALAAAAVRKVFTKKEKGHEGTVL